MSNLFVHKAVSVLDIITLDNSLKNQNTEYIILGKKEGTNLSIVDFPVLSGTNRSIKILHVPNYTPGPTTVAGVNLPQNYYDNIALEFYVYIDSSLNFDKNNNISNLRYNNIGYFNMVNNGQIVYEQCVKLRQINSLGDFTLSLNIWDNAGIRYWIHGTTVLPISTWVKIRLEVYSDSINGGAKLYINDIFEIEKMGLATDNFRKDYCYIGSCARPKYENGIIYFGKVNIYPF